MHPMMPRRSENLLSGKRAAVLISDGFEEMEYAAAKKALSQVGASVNTVSPKTGLAHGWHDGQWGNHYLVDDELPGAKHDAFDLLFLPGGERHAQKLTESSEALAFIAAFAESGKPVAAISDGVAVLAAAGAVAGCQVSTAPELRGDVESAGAVWVELPVAEHGSLLTSPHSANLPGLLDRLIGKTVGEELAEEEVEGQLAATAA